MSSEQERKRSFQPSGTAGWLSRRRDASAKFFTGSKTGGKIEPLLFEKDGFRRNQENDRPLKGVGLKRFTAFFYSA